MDTADFSKRGGHPYSLYWWTWNQTVPSSLGPFELEVRTGPNCPPPDKSTLDAAASLAATLEKLDTYVRDIVLGHYRWHQREAPEWLTEEGVPLNLDGNGLAGYIRDRALVLTQKSDENSSIEQCIYVTPLWDIEHSISLIVEDGRITTVNDVEVQLEGGVLQHF